MPYTGLLTGCKQEFQTLGIINLRSISYEKFK